MIRGCYYHVHLFQLETRSFYGKFIYAFSILLYVYVMPFYRLYEFSVDLYQRTLPKIIAYYAKCKSSSAEEQPAQITGDSKVESSSTKAFSFIAAVIVVDHSGAPTGLDYHTAVQNIIAAQERMASLMNEVATSQLFYADLCSAVDMLFFIVICLLMRFVQLTVR